jgi:hypothetical protein
LGVNAEGGKGSYDCLCGAEMTDFEVHLVGTGKRLELLEDVYDAAQVVYEWAEPTTELQQVEMLYLHDAFAKVEDND